MSDMKLIMENWKGFLRENPGQITTIGELHDYFKEQDPSTLEKLAAKYGGITAKLMGASAGVAAGDLTGAAGGAAGGLIAEKIIEHLLTAAITAFANLEDGSYPGGTAASYFDLEDNLTLFMRHLQTGGDDIVKPSIPETEVFEKMKQRIVTAVQQGFSPDTPIATILGDLTSQIVMDGELKAGERSGKVKVEPVR
jgi:hypothetical protein